MGQITPAQMQALLGYASKQLGVAPEELARMVQKGEMSNVADRETMNKLNRLAGDPNRVRQLLESPQVQDFLSRFTEG